MLKRLLSTLFILAPKNIATLLLYPFSTSAKITFPLVPHSTILQRRRLSQTPQTSSLYEGYGTHYVDLWIGHPVPQRQTVIVDTGSDGTAFPCRGCDECGNGYHTDTYFDWDKSETFRKLRCGECLNGDCASKDDERVCSFRMRYEEGSRWDAFEAVDLCYIGGPHDRPISADDDDYGGVSRKSFNLTFGCQTSATGLFRTQLADGIMGFSEQEGVAFKQMWEQGVIDKQVFSMCLSHYDLVSKSGTMAGVLSIGGVDERLWDTPAVYAKRVSKGGYYGVRVRAVYLMRGSDSYIGIGSVTRNGQKIVQLDVDEDKLISVPTIVDSGTTSTYFCKIIANAFNKAWNTIMETDTGPQLDKVDLNEEQLMSLPTIIIQLQGENPDLEDTTTGLAAPLDPKHPQDILIAISPKHYMERDENGLYTIRFYVDESSESVLGANTMAGHDVLFDLDNNLIGWAESHCDYNQLFSPATSLGTTTSDGQHGTPPTKSKETPSDIDLAEDDDIRIDPERIKIDNEKAQEKKNKFDDDFPIDDDIGKDKEYSPKIDYGHAPGSEEQYDMEKFQKLAEKIPIDYEIKEDFSVKKKNNITKSHAQTPAGIIYGTTPRWSEFNVGDKIHEFLLISIVAIIFFQAIIFQRLVQMETDRALISTDDDDDDDDDDGDTEMVGLLDGDDVLMS